MAQRTYLWSLAELAANALVNLGPMDQGDRAFFIQKAKEHPACQDVADILLGIGIKFKPGAHDTLTEAPYPCSENEWEQFQRDAKTMCEFMPEVFMLDGAKYSLPI